MLSSEFVSAVKAICDALPLDEINWAFCGDASLALQGFGSDHGEVNLLTTKYGAYEIERRLRSFVMKSVEYAQDINTCSHFGMLSIHGLSSEIIGAHQTRTGRRQWTKPIDPIKVRAIVEMENMRVPVTSLEYEAAMLKALGDEPKAAEIEEFLNHHNAGV